MQTALPKHLQIGETLIREIQAGLLATGERLPPERAMAARLGVAVGTLRKALADLAQQGLLERRQGSGNYVRAGTAPAGVYGFFRLELLTGGGLPTAQVLSVATGPDRHVMRRLRSLDGTLVAAEEIEVSREMIPRLTAEAGEALYRHYRQEFGLLVGSVEDRIGLGEMPDWCEGLPSGPCALIQRVARDGQGREIEKSRTWFDSGKCRYVNRMK